MADKNSKSTLSNIQYLSLNYPIAILFLNGLNWLNPAYSGTVSAQLAQLITLILVKKGSKPEYR